MDSLPAKCMKDVKHIIDVYMLQGHFILTSGITLIT